MYHSANLSCWFGYFYKPFLLGISHHIRYLVSVYPYPHVSAGLYGTVVQAYTMAGYRVISPYCSTSVCQCSCSRYRCYTPGYCVGSLLVDSDHHTKSEQVKQECIAGLQSHHKKMEGGNEDA